LAVGVTEIDDEDFYLALLTQLRREYEPVGAVEEFLVERIALSAIRVRRSVKFEAEAITAALHPQRCSKSRMDVQMEHQLAEMGGQTKILDSGFQCHFTHETFGGLAEVFGRYETTNERRLYRAIQELERVQIARKISGRKTLPPATSPSSP